MKSGIYTITNTIDGKIYVGLAVDVITRMRKHKENLIAGKHKNIHIQRAWIRDGEQSFKFEILEEWPEEYLYTMGHYWALLLNAHNYKYGYNIRPTHPCGLPRHSKETRDKISKRKKGVKLSSQALVNMSKARRGVPIHTDEWRKLQGERMKGFRHSDKSKIKMSKSQKGKIKSRESVNKAIATKIKNGTFARSKETIEKIKAARAKNGPAIWSDEARKKASDKRKGISRWTDKQKREIGERSKIMHKLKREQNSKIA